MNALPAGSGGVQGRAEPLPCQGAQLAVKPSEQSCLPVTGTIQVRVRLSADHAKRWLELPPKLREHAAAVVFGLGIDGVDLRELPALASELREARLVIANALQFALIKGATLDTNRVEKALDRIITILGGRP